MTSSEIRAFLLCVAHDACLCDHMGDMWNSICDAADEAGIKLDDDEINIEKIEKMGGTSMVEFVERNKNIKPPDRDSSGGYRVPR